MNYHIVLTVILTVFTIFWMVQGWRMAVAKTGPVNNFELNVTLAIVVNKIIGAIMLMGGCITLAVLLV